MDVLPRRDNLVEAPEDVVLTLESGGPTYLVGSPSAATVSIADDPPIVSVSATDPDADEATLGTGTFTFTRSGGDLDTPLAVSYAVGGTATGGQDYASLAGVILLAASAEVLVTPHRDNLVEDPETVTVTLSSGGTTYLIGNPGPATVTIADDPPVVSVAATDPLAAEADRSTGTFTFTRSGGDLDQPLAVSYSLGGTATPLADYAALAAVTFAAGADTAVVLVNPYQDNLGENPETVVVTVIEDPGIYLVGAPAQATVTIEDDPPIVTIVATDPGAEEGAFPTSGHFTVFRSGGLLAEALTVYYAVAETFPGLVIATPGADYDGLPGSVVIPADRDRARFSVEPRTDEVEDPGEAVRVVLSASPGAVPTYLVGVASSAVVVIADPCLNDYALPLPDGWTAEGLAGMRRSGVRMWISNRGGAGWPVDPGLDPPPERMTLGTVVRSPVLPLAAGTPVGLSYAVSTEDYSPFDDFVRVWLVRTDAAIPTGEDRLIVLANGAGVVPFDGTYQLVLGVFDVRDTVFDTIVDTVVEVGGVTGFPLTEPPLLSVAATDPDAREAELNPGTFTVWRTGPTDEPLPFSYTLSGTARLGVDYTLVGQAVIPAGATSVTLDVLPIQDYLPEPTETIVLTLRRGDYFLPCLAQATVYLADDDEWLKVTRRTADPLDGLAREQTGNVHVEHPLDLDLSPGRGQALEPALVYNGDSVTVRPVLQAFVPTDPDRSSPVLTLTLTWDEGVAGAQQVVTRQLNTADYAAGTPFTLGLQLPNAVGGIGRHTWKVHLLIDYPNPADEDFTETRSGTTFVAAQDTSPLGAGWTWSMTDRLVSVPAVSYEGQTYAAGMLRLFGTGGWRFYAFDPAHPDWFSNGPDNPGDGGVLTTSGGGYTYTEPDGTRRTFDAAGRQTAWVSADGTEAVQFGYDGAGRLGGLTAIDGSQSVFSYTGGRLTSVTDPAGHVTLIGPAGAMLGSITNPDTGLRTFGYDAAGRLTADSFEGFTQRWGYTAQGILQRYTLGVDQSYDIVPAVARGLVEPWMEPVVDGSVTDALNHTTRWELDARGRPLVQTAADGGVWKWKRDKDTARVVEATDPLTHTTTYSYDGAGHVTHEQFADGTSRGYGWDNLGTATSPLYRLRWVRDERNSYTTYLYEDGFGRLTREIDALGHSASWVYRPNGLLLSFRDKRGIETFYDYDTRRRLIQVTEALNVPGEQRTTITDYDTAGNVVTVAQPWGPGGYDINDQGQQVANPTRVVTRYGYDVMNRLESVTEADNVPALRRTTTSIYDKAGYLIGTQVLTGTPAVLRTTSYLYDTAGRQVEVIEGWDSPLARSTVTRYDRAGNIFEVQDPLLRVTRYGYDAVNRLKTVTEAYNDPGGAQRTTTTLYDPAGNLLERVDALGTRTSYLYDARNRVTTTTEAVSLKGKQRTTRTEYDPAGNVLSVTRPLTYDLRPDTGFQETNPVTVVTNYDYDALGRRTRTVEAANVPGQQRTTLYRYDEAGNLLSQSDALDYGVLTDPGTTLPPNTVTTSYGYDALGRRTTMIEAYDDDGPQGLQRTTTTAYDAADNVIQVSVPRKYDRESGTEDDPKASLTAYRYDALNRLVRQVEALGVRDQQRTTSYSYDVADQLTAVERPQGYDAVDAQEKLVEVPVGGVVTRYDYDLLGRRTRTVEAANVPGQQRTTLYRYDAADNLLSESHARVPGELSDPVTTLPANTVTTSYGYDALNRRTTMIEAYQNLGAYGLQRTTRSYFDALDRVWKVERPRFFDGQTVPENEQRSVTTRYVYDALGREVFVLEADETDLSRTTARAYDASDRLIWEESPRWYDGVMQPEWMGDIRSVTTSFGYDALGRQTTMIEAYGLRGSTPQKPNNPRLQRTTSYAYDVRGNVLAEKRPLDYDPPAGQTLPAVPTVTTSYVYDLLGRRVKVIEGAGLTQPGNHFQHTTLLDYDGADQLIRTTRSQDYDAFNATSGQWGPPSTTAFTTTYAYDVLGRQTKMIEPVSVQWTGGEPWVRTRTTETAYDAADRVVSVATPRWYDEEALPTWMDGIRAVTTVYEYDALGRRVRMIEAEGLTNPRLQRTTSYAYDVADNLLAEQRSQDADVQYLESNDYVQATTKVMITSYAYDLLDRRVAVIEGYGLRDWDEVLQHTTLLSYDAADRLAEQRRGADYDWEMFEDFWWQSEQGYSTRYSYDYLGRLTRTVEDVDLTGRKRTTLWRYDAADHVLTEIKPLVYGTLQDPGTTLPAGTVATSYAYDALGRQTKVIEAYGDTAPGGLQRTTSTDYDAADRVTEVRTPLLYDSEPLTPLRRWVTTSYGYDPLGRQNKVVEAVDVTNAQRTTTMAYDAADNLLVVYKPLAYDLTDRPAVYAQASVPTVYRYDWLNRPTEVTETAEPGKTRTSRTDYDAANRILSFTARRRYDQEGEGTPADPYAVTTSHAYDPLGRRVRTIEAFNVPGLARTLTTEYDAADNVLSETRPVGDVQYGNGEWPQTQSTVVTAYVYDLLGRRTAVIEAANVEATKRTTRTEYDPAGNAIVVVRPLYTDTQVVPAEAVPNVRMVTTRYDYDGLNRQTQVIEAVGLALLQRTTSTTYDAADHAIAVDRPIGYDRDAANAVVANPERARTTYVYDALGRQTEVIEVAVSTNGWRRTTTMAYDAADNLRSLTRPQTYDTDEQGNAAGGTAVRVRTEYKYDALNRRSEVIEAANYADKKRTTTTLFDPADRVERLIRPLVDDAAAAELVNGLSVPRDVKTDYRYDFLGRQTKVVEAVGQQDVWAVIPAGEPRPSLQRTTTFAYDAADHLEYETRPQGYDVLPSGPTDSPTRIETRYVYDPLGRRTEVMEAYSAYNLLPHQGGMGLKRTTTTVYDLADRPLLVIRPRAHDYESWNEAVNGPRTFTTGYRYDALGRRVEVIDTLGQSTETVYDGADHAIILEDALGKRTAHIYDPLGREVLTNLPDDTTTTFAYDAADRLKAQTDAAGLVTQYDYDKLGRKIRATFPKGQGYTETTSLAWKYDASDNVTEVTDQFEGQTSVTTYHYDALNRRERTTGPNGFDAVVEYDGADRPRLSVDRDGRQIKYTYDALGRLRKEEWVAFAGHNQTTPSGGSVLGSPAETFVYDYDAADQRTLARNGWGTYTFLYDTLGRVRWSQDPYGIALDYQYDAANRVLRREDSEGAVLVSEYDEAERLKKRTLQGLEVRMSEYTPRNQVETLERYNAGTRVGGTEYGYDDVGRVTLVQHTNQNQQAIFTQTSSYADHGRLNNDHSVSSNFDENKTYQYVRQEDQEGGLLGWFVGQLGLITGAGGWTYKYDREGNVVAKAKSGERWEYAYDHAHRLIEAEKWTPSDSEQLTWGLRQRITYRYDALGNRAEMKTENFNGWLGLADTVQTENYQYDGTTLMADRNATQGLVSRYLRGDDGELLGRVERVARGSNWEPQTGWYLNDRTDSVRLITNAAGVVQVYYRYDGSGVGTASEESGNWWDAWKDRWRSQGQEFEEQTGLYYQVGRHADTVRGDAMGSDPRELASGDYHPGRNTGSNPTKISNGAWTALGNAWIGGYLGDVGDVLGLNSIKASDSWWSVGGKVLEAGRRLNSDPLAWGSLLQRFALRAPQTAVSAVALTAQTLSWGHQGLDAWERATWSERLTGVGNVAGELGVPGLGLFAESRQARSNRGAWFSDSLRRGVRDFKAGAVDAVTMGYGRDVRQWWSNVTGYGDDTDYESDGYQVGQWGGTAAQVALDIALAATGVGAPEAAANLGTTLLRGYRLMQTVGGAGHALSAFNRGDTLGGLTAAAGVISSGLHLRTGNFNPCATPSVVEKWLWRASYGLQAASAARNAAVQVAEGRYLQAGMDAALQFAPDVWQMTRVCFVGETELRTPEGLRRIDRFEVGDRILSRAEHDPSAPVVVSIVEEVFVNTGRIWHLHVGGRLIRTTGEHPFYVHGKGWTAVAELQVGDLLALEDGWLAVEGVLDTGEYETVYNLRVREYHTYFVGAPGWGFSVWAHNVYRDVLNEHGRVIQTKENVQAEVVRMLRVIGYSDTDAVATAQLYAGLAPLNNGQRRVLPGNELHDNLRAYIARGGRAFQPEGTWERPRDGGRGNTWKLPTNGVWTGIPGHSDFVPDNPSQLRSALPGRRRLGDGEVIQFRFGRANFGPLAEYEFVSGRALGGNRNTDTNDMHQETASYFNRMTIPHPDGPGVEWTGTYVKGWASREQFAFHHAGDNVVQLIAYELHGAKRAGFNGVSHQEFTRNTPAQTVALPRPAFVSLPTTMLPATAGQAASWQLLYQVAYLRARLATPVHVG